MLLLGAVFCSVLFFIFFLSVIPYLSLFITLILTALITFSELKFLQQILNNKNNQVNFNRNCLRELLKSKMIHYLYFLVKNMIEQTYASLF